MVINCANMKHLMLDLEIDALQSNAFADGSESKTKKLIFLSIY